MAKTSVIITTYNGPDALGAVLEGFRNQSKTDFEIVIADNGSKQDTADLIGHLAR